MWSDDGQGFVAWGVAVAFLEAVWCEPKPCDMGADCLTSKCF